MVDLIKRRSSATKEGGWNKPGLTLTLSSTLQLAVLQAVNQDTEESVCGATSHSTVTVLRATTGTGEARLSSWGQVKTWGEPLGYITKHSKNDIVRVIVRPVFVAVPDVSTWWLDLGKATKCAARWLTYTLQNQPKIDREKDKEKGGRGGGRHAELACPWGLPPTVRTLSRSLKCVRSGEAVTGKKHPEDVNDHTDESQH